ncbi:nascent polypeptide-associated complex subunit alpha, muscle-specific form-like [Schistocerca americana]|uniref:nascent polypeptide-associated complex subunit alpha, muscle-specific form-like n=1 Tax=Schistocerca americana TaxID=7009 RepID=UPI001F4FDEE5|nr:nascent polypeptide-associated complex subunit alpha, muscle-specific form-like [Schistocerca americana]XP_046987280.1 nascent polypeptide-associated complex subunit alpha, muscle-specific form-like [Schistocerca americana]
MEGNNIAANVAAVVAASEHALVAASNAPTPATAPPGYRPLTTVELFVVMNRMAKAATASEREAAEKAYIRFLQYDLPAALPGAASEEAKVPPGAPPGVSTQEDTALPEAAPKGAEPPGVASHAPTALLAPPTVQASQEAADLPAASHEDVIPEANLEKLIHDGEAMEVSLPSRKRPADDDESSESTPSSAHRMPQQKKKQTAPEGATEDIEAAEEEEDEFVVPKRKHTARARKLEQVQPLPTANSFESAPIDTEAMEEAPRPPKRVAPPPINVLWKDTFRAFLEKFSEGVSAPPKIKSLGREMLRITPANMDDYRATMRAATYLKRPGAADADVERHAQSSKAPAMPQPQKARPQPTRSDSKHPQTPRTSRLPQTSHQQPSQAPPHPQQAPKTAVRAHCVPPPAPHTKHVSCGYLRESRRLPAAPRPAATSSASTAAPPPRSGKGCEPRRLETVTDHAVAGFQAAFAAERAALKEELAAVHRQLQQLRDELRANKKKPPAPAAAPAVSRPVGVAVATQTPAAVSRPVGVDVATQTAAAPPPAAMQEVAPMDTDDVPPRLPPSAVAAASKGAKAPPVSSQAEKPTKKRRIHLPFPDVTNVQVVLKDITAALKNWSYPYADQPYPFTPPDQPIPSLPHRPLPLRTYRDAFMEVLTKKEIALLNSHPIFTPSQWDALVDVIDVFLKEEFRSGRRKMDSEALEAMEDITRKHRQVQ